MPQSLVYIHPITVYKYKWEFYVSRAWLFNELAKKYNIKLYCGIKEKDDLDLKIYCKLDDSIDVNNFFMYWTSIWSFLKNFLKYKKKLDTIVSQFWGNALFFVHYPAWNIWIIVSYLLRRKNLVVRVKSDPIAQFTIHWNSIQRFFRMLFKPLASIVYQWISRYIFDNNLIFYTSDITVSRNNHIDQIELISCSNFNTDRSLIKSVLTNKIAFVWSEWNQKWISILLKALNVVSKDIQLHIIWLDCFNKNKNIQLSKKLNIIFHWKVYNRKEFYKLLAACDVLTMPSYGEKQWKVQLEAMSVGVVPVCSDWWWTYRTITNYYNWLLFRQGNFKQLAGCIELLYDNNELYRDLRKSWLEYVANLSVEKMAEKMSKIINNFYRVKNIIND